MGEMKSWEIVLIAVAAAVVIAGIVVVARELPPMRRYLRIKRM